MVKKLMLAGAIFALAAAPASAHPGQGHQGSEVHPSSEPGSQGKGSHGNADHGNASNGNAEHGKSHKCNAHSVAYVVAGKLISDTFAEGEHHTVSGQVTIEVERANHHAKALKGTTETYTVEGARLRGPLKLEALAAEDWVKLIGKTTVLAPKCATGEFSPTTTIEKVVLHAPHHHG